MQLNAWQPFGELHGSNKNPANVAGFEDAMSLW
jgi:hypothetical protein